MGYMYCIGNAVHIYLRDVDCHAQATVLGYILVVHLPVLSSMHSFTVHKGSGFGRIVSTTTAKPALQRHQVKIRVTASGLCDTNLTLHLSFHGSRS